MRAFTETEVLSLWERTRGQKPLLQALEYLACAAPDRPRDQWAAVPFGCLCQALFRLRSVMFGNRMPCVASCPTCGERVEFVFEGPDMTSPEDIAGNLMQVEWEGHVLEIRLPTARDLLSSRSAADLLSLCANQPVELNAAWIEAASERLAEGDPLCETVLDLTCPSCQHSWQAVFDVVTYLSHEVSHHARRLLREVHELASAYGWAEPTILALGASRRRAYLDLVGA